MVMTGSLPSRPAELGRIRLGWRAPNKSGGGTHPEKLDMWRLTSKDRSLLDYAASHPDIGGTVQEWQDAPGEGKQWEVYTETDVLKIAIPTVAATSVHWEVWSASGCSLRCNGQAILTDVAHPERVGLECPCTGEPTACGGERVLRMNVYLLDLPGLGVWRLDTRGYNATAELLDMFQRLHDAGVAYSLIEGTLRLEQRTQKKLVAQSNGKPKSQTFHFSVPTFRPIFTQRELLAGASRAMLAAPLKQLQAPVDVESGEDESDALLDAEARITEFIRAQGTTDEGIKVYWQKMREKYITFSPALLDNLYGQLVSAAERRQKTAQDGAGAPQMPSTSSETQEQPKGATLVLEAEEAHAHEEDDKPF